MPRSRSQTSIWSEVTSSRRGSSWRRLSPLGASAANPWMRWRYSMRLFDSLGRLWLARGEPARAREFADRGLDLATSTRSRKNLVKGWRLRGRIAIAQREVGEAETALGQALPRPSPSATRRSSGRRSWQGAALDGAAAPRRGRRRVPRGPGGRSSASRRASWIHVSEQPWSRLRVSCRSMSEPDRHRLGRVAPPGR